MMRLLLAAVVVTAAAMFVRRRHINLDTLSGRAKQAAGKWTGDHGLRVDGVVDKVKGQAKAAADKSAEAVTGR